jgi:glycosyltransferase involved in cell wall biosynthesis
MFSRSQADIFKSAYPNHHVFIFNLPLIGFGQPTNHRPLNGDVKFLSFGTLNYAKNIDLLIDAACLLYEKGVRGFKVSINGSCDEWSWYQQRIKYPDIFELDIRRIENREIPNLFNGAHYFVQPYRVISQSGPMKIAFNYNVPVIVSNLPGFLDEMEEGVNGYSFERGNLEDLARVMKECIDSHELNYNLLREKMQEYTMRHYSSEVLEMKYSNMFETIISVEK